MKIDNAHEFFLGRRYAVREFGGLVSVTPAIIKGSDAKVRR